jgi:hypothetical protein
MADPPRVVGNRIQVDGKLFEAKPAGGGRFRVVNSTGQEVGYFAIKDRQVQGEDGGFEGVPSMKELGTLWAIANLKAPLATATATAPAPAPAESPPAAAPAAAPPARAPAPASASAPLPNKEPAPSTAPATPRRAVARAVTPTPAASSADPAPRPPPEPALPADAALVGGDDSDLIPGRSICRVAVHPDPDQAMLNQAKQFHAWLRNQPGVRASYLARDPKSGKTMSVTIWENQEKLSAIRYAQPPRGAAQLKSISVELMYIVG